MCLFTATAKAVRMKRDPGLRKTAEVVGHNSLLAGQRWEQRRS